MNPKIAVVLLIIIIVLFAGVTAVGMTRNNGDSTTPGWTERIGDALSLERPLDADALGASSPAACRSQFIQGAVTLSDGASCTLLIRESSSLLPVVRVFSLSLEQGDAVRVEVRQPGQITVRETLDEDTPEAEFNIHDQGGSVELRCQAAGNGSCGIGVAR